MIEKWKISTLDSKIDFTGAMIIRLNRCFYVTHLISVAEQNISEDNIAELTSFDWPNIKVLDLCTYWPDFSQKQNH